MVGLASFSSTLEEAVKLAKRPIKIVYVRETQGEALPAGGIDFNELISTDGVDLASLKKIDWDCNEVAMLPYSR